MKKLALLSLIISTTAFGQVPFTVEAPVDHLFVPNGFDNNDHVEVVVTGKFPNPCFTRNKYEVKVQGNEIKINMTSLYVEEYLPTKCEPLAVPFSETVSVGNLQSGNYNVVVNAGGEHELKEKISVSESASNGIDDNFYPIVDYVELGFTGGASGDAVLMAQSPSPCLVFDKVKYLTNKKDTLSVMPILKKISQNCPESRKRIAIPIKFDSSSFTDKEVLLYVRTIDGRSVSTFVGK